jgi:hypothetical protein
MAGARYRLTAALQKEIVAFIRAGGYPHVAAEAAGLPREVFARWMERGRRRGAPAIYRAFARAVREAEAQARLDAEVNVRKAKPLDWLKAGPGKENAERPGWTNASKSRAAAEGSSKLDGQRIWSDILNLFGRCAEQLAAYPDARAALAAWLSQLSSSAEK